MSLARWQFALTSVFHFFFVGLTLGLSVLVAYMEWKYVRTGDEQYKRMTKFWGKLFLINFTLGVVTGIVQEFQFGMNWAEYSRFVGDIFGVPLAIEALLAFFLESTFLGVWFFGWDRLPKKVHVWAITLVAFGSNLSALWIIIANSWMQRPVGYTLEGGRALMTSFADVLTNKHVWLQFPHVFFAGLLTAAFFVAGISAWHLLRGNEIEHFRRSLKISLVVALVATPMVALIGHEQAQYVEDVQPMKMAAMEALWETEEPAGFSVFVIVDQDARENTVDIRIPRMLSFLANNDFSSEVLGMNDLQAQYEAEYGEGDYIPPVNITYYSFRVMVGMGTLMGLTALVGVILWKKGTLDTSTKFLRFLVWMIPAGYIANSTGWLVTELGRAPWLVQGLMTLRDGVSPNVGWGTVTISLVGFTLLYGALMSVDFWLLARTARTGPSAIDDPQAMAAPEAAAAGGA